MAQDEYCSAASCSDPNYVAAMHANLQVGRATHVDAEGVLMPWKADNAFFWRDEYDTLACAFAAAAA